MPYRQWRSGKRVSEQFDLPDHLALEVVDNDISFAGRQDVVLVIEQMPRPGQPWERAGTLELRLRASLGAIEVRRLVVNQNAQGHGIMRHIVRGIKEFGLKCGFSEIRVEANIDVGGYAWARYGFWPCLPGWCTLKFELEKRLDNLAVSEDKKDKVRRLLEAGAERLPVLARLSTEVPSGGKNTTLGKALLLGLSWDGELQLNEDRQMSYFRRIVEPS